MFRRHALPLATAAVLAATLPLASCRGCGSSSLGPLADAPHGDFGSSGVAIEQPLEGDTVSGQWVAVTGWVDLTRVRRVAVVGAPVDGFYEPTGHVGVPSTPVVLRKDGRFLAARVPLSEGATEIVVLPFLASGGVGEAIRLKVTGKDTANVPATLIAQPGFGKPTLSVSFQAHASFPASEWQWDWEGDGVFDEQGQAPTHSYRDEGTFPVLARTKQAGRWTYAVTPVQVSNEPPVTHSAQVNQPSLIVTVPYIDAQGDVSRPETDELAWTRYVLVADGDEVKVFDAKLALLTTLRGLSKPQGMSGDEEGRIYVADTGNDRIVRFLADGSVDASFGVQGSFRGNAVAPLKAPTSLGIGWFNADGGIETSLLFVLDLGGRFQTCAFRSTEPGCDEETNPPRMKGYPGPPTTFYLAPPGFPHSGRITDREGDVIFQFGTSLAGPGISRAYQPLSTLRSVISFSRGGDQVAPYWVAVDAEGVLHEWLISSSSHRRTKLSYPLTAVAVDELSIELRHELAGDEIHDLRSHGPIVLYLAGAGRIERRVLPVLEAGFF
jgi:hypothetical protein